MCISPYVIQLSIEPRIYQQTIAAKSIDQNTLVVLPTGLGKTALALMIIAARLNKYDGKAVFLAPTKPLVHQHYQSFLEQSSLSEQDVVVLTGEIPAVKRAKLFADAKVVFSTPQGFENDVFNSRFSMEHVNCLVFDEAHRAVGDYSYVNICSAYMNESKHPHVLALTASPGSDKTGIEEVCKNLYVEHIEARDRDDPDVKPYVQEMHMKWIDVELTKEYREVLGFLKFAMLQRVKRLQQLGFLKNYKADRVSRVALLELQRYIQGQLVPQQYAAELLEGISLTAQVMKIMHAVELAESQGIRALLIYLDDLFTQAKSTKTKATKILAQDEQILQAYACAKKHKLVDHPKVHKLLELIKKTVSSGNKALVFNQYRDSIAYLVEFLQAHGIRAMAFVGQAKKRGSGLSQKQQIALLEEFRNGAYDVLVMSSVGEEGLDIPQVELVVFYEPVPSVIRTIQRRGRTGRHDAGHVAILVAKGTRDEAYRWAAHHKEKSVKSVIKNVTLSKPEQATLQSFSDTFILADVREKKGGVISELTKRGVRVELKQLDVADYILGVHIGVEFKTVQDFADSLVDGRLLEQAKRLKSSFSSPMIIVQGEQSLFSARNIHPHAIYGLMATLMLTFKIPVFFSRNASESAALLELIAKKQTSDPKAVSSSKQVSEPVDVLASVPGLGPESAKLLMEAFGSLSGVIGAQQLDQAQGIGPKRATELREFFDKPYKS